MKTRFLIFISIVLSTLFIANCSGQPKNLPPESKYEEYTTLMMSVGSKFAQETDAKKLHKAAISTQTVRLITCSDFNDECSLYGTFVSFVVKVSADGNITTSEREDLQKKLAELQNAVETGKKLLREAWTKKKKGN